MSAESIEFDPTRDVESRFFDEAAAWLATGRVDASETAGNLATRIIVEGEGGFWIVPLAAGIDLKDLQDRRSIERTPPIASVRRTPPVGDSKLWPSIYDYDYVLPEEPDETGRLSRGEWVPREGWDEIEPEVVISHLGTDDVMRVSAVRLRDATFVPAES